MLKGLLAFFVIVSSSFEAAAALEDGLQIVDELNSPDFATRLKATSGLGDHIAERYRVAAEELGKGGRSPRDWQAIKAAVLRRAELDGLSEIRGAIKRAGSDAQIRFASLSTRLDDAVRNAALSAGLEAPGDFETELIAFATTPATQSPPRIVPDGGIPVLLVGR